jgi:hypothetical protein
MNIPKILIPFLKPTVDEKTPTDLGLDNDIEFVSYLLHHLLPVLTKIVKIKIKRFFIYRWKFILGRIIIISALLFLSYLSFVKVMHVRIIKTNPIQKDVTLSYPSDTSMNLRNFLLQIAYIESRYNDTIHKKGSQYLGLFQLGNDVRRIAKMSDVPNYIFLHHPELQYIAMIKLLKHNKKYLQPYINKYSGKVIDGILITESGILALAHLGASFAKSCLDRGIIPETDDHGNKPRVYAKLGGYNLQLDKYDSNGLRLN